MYKYTTSRRQIKKLIMVVVAGRWAGGRAWWRLNLTEHVFVLLASLPLCLFYVGLKKKKSSTQSFQFIWKNEKKETSYHKNVILVLYP